ncbi:MAG: hypothetical protein U5J64_06335 [Halobacteriales archaeon]|nr:hypothetical protein [Halobacteriales archaeon]
MTTPDWEDVVEMLDELDDETDGFPARASWRFRRTLSSPQQVSSRASTSPHTGSTAKSAVRYSYEPVFAT